MDRKPGLVLLLALAVACAREHGPPTGTVEQAGAKEDGAMSKLEVKSSAFEHQRPIPPKYTCDGDDVSPPLSWSAGPAGTAGYALIADDPDAPGGTYVHWVAWNITGTSLGENVAKGEQSKLRQGRSSFQRAGYGGPCPPSGTHRYFFKVYALDRRLDLDERTDADKLRKAFEGHVLGQGELSGTYSRQ